MHLPLVTLIYRKASTESIGLWWIPVLQCDTSPDLQRRTDGEDSVAVLPELAINSIRSNLALTTVGVPTSYAHDR